MRTGELGKMSVAIITYYGKTLKLNISNNKTISEIAKLVQEKEGIQANNQIYYYKNNKTKIKLEHVRTLSYYNIPNNAILRLEEEGMNVLETMSTQLSSKELISLPSRLESTIKVDKIINPEQITNKKYDLSYNVLEQQIKLKPKVASELFSPNIGYWDQVRGIAQWNFHKDTDNDFIEKYFNPTNETTRLDFMKSAIKYGWKRVYVLNNTEQTAALSLTWSIGSKVLPIITPFVNIATDVFLETLISTYKAMGWDQFIFTAATITILMQKVWEWFNAPSQSTQVWFDNIMGEGRYLGDIIRYRKDNYTTSDMKQMTGVSLHAYKTLPTDKNSLVNYLDKTKTFPSKITKNNNVLMNLQLKYGDMNITEDDIFIVQGQTPERLIINTILPWTEDKLTEMMNHDPPQIQLSDWTKDHGNRHFPANYVQLTYLVNLFSDQAADTIELPHNFIATLRDQNSKIISQYVKLFDEVDLWVELQPPDRHYYAEKTKTVNNKKKCNTPFTDLQIVRIGPQEFFFNPIPDIDRCMMWKFNARDLDIVIDEGKLYDLDKYLTRLGRERKDIYMGQFIGLPFRFPPPTQTRNLMDYYIKVKNTSPGWIRLRQPMKEFEDTPLKIIIQDGASKMDISLLSEKYHKLSTITLTDDQIRGRSTRLVKSAKKIYSDIVTFIQYIYKTHVWNKPTPVPNPNIPFLIESQQQFDAVVNNYTTEWSNAILAKTQLSTLVATNYLDLISKISQKLLTQFNTQLANQQILLNSKESADFNNLKSQTNNFTASIKQLSPLSEIDKDKQIKEIYNLLKHFNTQVVQPLQNLNIYLTNLSEVQKTSYIIGPSLERQLTQDASNAQNIANNQIHKLVGDIPNLQNLHWYNTNTDAIHNNLNRNNMMNQIQNIKDILRNLYKITNTLDIIYQGIRSFSIKNENNPILAVQQPAGNNAPSPYPIPPFTIYQGIPKLTNAQHNTRILIPIQMINSIIAHINDVYNKNTDIERPNKLTDIKGLGWLNYSYKFSGGGSNATGTASSQLMRLNESDIRELAAAQIIFKSEGVLMLETLLDYISNPFRAPVRWFDTIPKVTLMRRIGSRKTFAQPLRWLAIQKNQKAVHDILIKFVLDEITNPLLVQQGISKLIDIVMPPYKGQWTTEDQDKIVHSFMQQLGARSVPQATITVDQLSQLPQSTTQIDVNMRGGGHHENEGCGCNNSSNESKEKDFAMFDKQLGGQIQHQPRFETPVIRLTTIDPNKVQNAVNKLIARLMSNDNLQKEQNTLKDDELLSFEAGRQFNENILQPLFRLSTVRARIKWLNRSGNKQATHLLIDALWTEGTVKGKRKVVVSAIGQFVKLFQPTGIQNYTKSAKEFNAAGIVRQFENTAATTNSKSAARKLIERVLRDSDAVQVDSAFSADDIEQKLDTLLNQLSRKLSDQKKKDFILGRPGVFQIAWIKYVDEFRSDQNAVEIKLSRMINMFRAFKPEKDSILEAFWVRSIDRSNIPEAVNKLVSELIGTPLDKPSLRGFDKIIPKKDITPYTGDSGAPGEKLRRDKEKQELSDKTYKQTEILRDRERDYMNEWMKITRETLNKRLSIYEKTFEKRTQTITSQWGATSQARTASRKFDGEIRNKDTEFTKELSRQKNLTAADKNEIKKQWIQDKNNISTQFKTIKKNFEDGAKYNPRLKKTGMTSDTQKLNYQQKGLDNGLRQPTTRDYRGFQRKQEMQLPEQTEHRTFQDILKQRQTGYPELPPGPITGFQRKATYTGVRPGLNNMNQIQLGTPAEYTRSQQAIRTLDPSKIKLFMQKIGDIASTLPAAQASKILEQFQRRVLNELDKYCIRQGWMLFDERNNKCV